MGDAEGVPAGCEEGDTAAGGCGDAGGSETAADPGGGVCTGGDCVGGAWVVMVGGGVVGEVAPHGFRYTTIPPNKTTATNAIPAIRSWCDDDRLTVRLGGTGVAVVAAPSGGFTACKTWPSCVASCSISRSQSLNRSTHCRVANS